MKQYIVDAFTDTLFTGNPAAVCILDRWLPEELMIAITVENNLSETAFAVPTDTGYHLRWFTPGGEIDLCGHATLATAYVITRVYRPDWTTVTFQTLSGDLTVTKEGDLFRLDLPSYALEPLPVTQAMTQALGVRPVGAYLGRDLVCVLESRQQVEDLTPDLDKVAQLPGLLQHVTAWGGGEYDCVSRSFAPKLAIPEDPVCGSGHCHIAPLWAGQLKKDTLVARQASRRGGVLVCQDRGDRVSLAGKAVLFAVSDILPDGAPQL